MSSGWVYKFDMYEKLIVGSLEEYQRLLESKQEKELEAAEVK